MKSSYLGKAGKCGALFLLLYGTIPSTNKAVPIASTAMVTSSNDAKSPGQEFIAELRKFCNDFKDTTSFSKFCVKLVTFLEQYAAAIKNEFPTLSIQELIKALKDVQNKTSSMMIGFKLHPFFKELPHDLQDVSKWRAALNRRLSLQ